ncbi:hypothetical protein SARC_05705 [Sphaeroforma arctica JP610]|uniref:C2H2-type domain-containing protein n=1 Tax=Sphaeroforma arctica JP610 TaxID=667725 RepID=A0A0L0FZE1_9EUKA|nr:hypothetical protein SARC_05705 [Sphaeroforma arctica JP610]KNC81999.1 hypothetical protein SARC_05705 [Sphaeroforma arctica JP610]|eukprot:XP_014155901.1 hypothetical protein SARC_05705 [Sphaeroforma arctica JP610]
MPYKGLSESDKLTIRRIKASIGFNSISDAHIIVQPERKEVGNHTNISLRQGANNEADSTEEGSRSWSSCKSFKSKQLGKTNEEKVQYTSPSRSDEGDDNECTSSGAGSQKRMPAQTHSRVRRNISQLSRPFVCEYNRCGRAYTTKHSRQLHYRLKHPHGDGAFSNLVPSSAESTMLKCCPPPSNTHKLTKGRHISNNLPVSSQGFAAARNQNQQAIVGCRQDSGSNNMQQSPQNAQRNTGSIPTDRMSNTGQYTIAASVDCSQHPLRQVSYPTSVVQVNDRRTHNYGQPYTSERPIMLDYSAAAGQEWDQRCGPLCGNSSSSGRLTKTPLAHLHAKRDISHTRRRKQGRKRARESDRRMGIAQCPIHTVNQAPPPCEEACCQGAYNDFGGMSTAKDVMRPSSGSLSRIERQSSDGSRFADYAYVPSVDYRQSHSGPVDRPAQYYAKPISNGLAFDRGHGARVTEMQNFPVSNMICTPVPLGFEPQSKCQAHAQQEQMSSNQGHQMWIPVLEQTYMNDKNYSALQYGNPGRTPATEVQLSTTPSVREYSDIRNAGVSYPRTSSVTTPSVREYSDIRNAGVSYPRTSSV